MHIIPEKYIKYTKSTSECEWSWITWLSESYIWTPGIFVKCYCDCVVEEKLISHKRTKPQQHWLFAHLSWSISCVVVTHKHLQNISGVHGLVSLMVKDPWPTCISSWFNEGSFGIGNWAQGNYCLVITQANNFSITLFHMPNCQFPIPKIYITSF